jgi:hypothetical protein
VAIDLWLLVEPQALERYLWALAEGTIIGKLLQKHPELFELSISMTTRSARPTEMDGREYFFVSKETFQKVLLSGNTAYR